jgi:glycosyltransferase involved in cell wall biosynthesis
MGRKLSVIVITFNEERTITRCLQSLIPLSDNIIVVDSRSTDSTVAAARQLTPHVFVRDWEGFSEQKTFALSKAAHDWVLWVDAD